MKRTSFILRICEENSSVIRRIVILRCLSGREIQFRAFKKRTQDVRGNERRTVKSVSLGAHEEFVIPQ